MESPRCLIAVGALATGAMAWMLNHPD